MNLVLKHYAKLKPLSCTVVSGDINKLITIKFDNIKRKDISFVKGDPVILATLGCDGELLLYGGRVIAFTLNNDNYLIFSKRINVDYEDQKRREFYRYPASLLADVRLMGTSNWDDACIIDISYSGMRIYSKGNYEIGSNLEVNIFLTNNILKFEAVVVRKTKSFNRYEYGIQIINKDRSNLYNTKNKIYQLLKDENALIYKHLLGYNY
ncbi:PilZ domain-containing protein [Ruminiclostridium herbifermentans]|uniref:PilZ domain-containing protein n=1 Tax=Ruminiclostridium herbifermentans TaxID=2488810 RepID=A0A7H1VR21_9FIRM|nr:PilZ domain-containing protein [Ruminiclostridium herbifermentans]QNU67833.1 PilZ domain-containing protein [Ruminiclostridium herbifermentans]